MHAVLMRLPSSAMHAMCMLRECVAKLNQGNFVVLMSHARYVHAVAVSKQDLGRRSEFQKNSVPSMLPYVQPSRLVSCFSFPCSAFVGVSPCRFVASPE